jgi:hypothetical protein
MTGLTMTAIDLMRVVAGGPTESSRINAGWIR